MLNRKTSFKKVLGSAIAASLLLGTVSVAQASLLEGREVTPLITAGALPDTPAAHIDPNVSSSRFSGVVSLEIRKNGGTYLCSGALVGKRQVISAGHCVDTNGNGSYVDLNAPGNHVNVRFNSNGTYNAIIAATKIAVDPDYKGFGKCPVGVNSFCVGDDIAVITMSQDAPASAKIYKVAVNPLQSGQHIIMAGYGTTGTGTSGYISGSAGFSVKRSGENYVDLFDGDDEQGFRGQSEIFYADFDGGGKDLFCDAYRVCTPKLPNHRESGIGAGDSGGPSFVEMYGELMLVANNTFSSIWYADNVAGTFGTAFGGIIMSAYTDFLQDSTDGNISFVPEPTSMALLGLGSLMLLGARRRRSAK